MAHIRPELYSERPPALDPVWLAHERKAGLLDPKPVWSNLKDQQQAYSRACRERNASMLAGRDAHLKDGLTIHDSSLTSRDGHVMKTRTYEPATGSQGPYVVYYHGGGLCVGDVDSEDLSCRRLCKEGHATVVSIDYRLAPDHAPDDALRDAYDGFCQAVSDQGDRAIVLVGSSSGGHLAALVSQRAEEADLASKIRGLLLRGPVTVDATGDGHQIPPRFRGMHTSFTPPFESSLLKLSSPARMTRVMPLEAESFAGLPKTFLQLCTNDMYYSDGLCYAKALADAGVEVQLDVLQGWPHTFWLKAPELQRSLQAEEDMIRGLKWLLS